MGAKIKINKLLNLERLPNHIAIILDGNGRWATKRGLPRNAGHKAGCENLKKVVQHIYDLGIKSTTLFLFSTENWKRPQEEIDGIFKLVDKYLTDEVENLVKNGAKVTILGDYRKLPENLVKTLDEILVKTADCKTARLNLAINYGGRDEILRAVNKAIKDNKEIISEQDFEKLLYSSDLPPLDFVIRTSGELRLSNFMLWQMAYSELYFTKTLWPDFSPQELQLALINYQRRKRRFGKV